MPFTPVFLLDAGGNFVVDANDNRIIVGYQEVSISNADPEYRPIGHSVRRDIIYVRNFNITPNANLDSYSLQVNNRYVGNYPTLEAALGVLSGIWTRCGCAQGYSQSKMFNYLLTKGSSIGVAGSSYLQEITWNMTGRDTCTIGSSTGLDIISNTKTTQLIVAASPSGQPRLWNGLEADNYGAVSGVFASNAACQSWWANYGVEVRVNGGAWEALGVPVSGTTQTNYINTTANYSRTSIDFVNGDVVDFRVSSAV